jgi:hypothetical protein
VYGGNKDLSHAIVMRWGTSFKKKEENKNEFKEVGDRRLWLMFNARSRGSAKGAAV